MYLPTHFEGSHEQAADLMLQHPFATLVSVDDAGLPFVTHLPLHMEMNEEAADLHFVGACRQGNPHWRFLRDRSRVVVTFLGPHAYLSPKVYPDLVRVPTWNYLTVHCTVQATLLEDAASKDSLLKKLIGDHEPAYAEQWRGMDDAYAGKMLAGIVAFELQVMDLQCKLKLNQHRPEAFSATQAIYECGNDASQGLGRWMKRTAMDISDKLKS